MNKKSTVAEIEIVYHNKKRASERPFVYTAGIAYNLVLESWHTGKIESQEEFKVLLLDTRQGCLGISNVSCGALDTCTIDISLIFAMALKARAANIILAHNHPSGDTSPSEEDKRVTRRFKDAVEILGISVLDHLVITKEAYYSFAEKHLV